MPPSPSAIVRACQEDDQTKAKICDQLSLIPASSAPTSTSEAEAKRARKRHRQAQVQANGKELEVIEIDDGC